MIFFLYGEDTYRSRQKSNLIKERFVAKDKSKLNLVQIDGTKALYKDLKKELTSSPFLHDKKLIVIENLLTKNKQVKIFEEINNLIKSETIPDFIFIIFIEDGKPDKRKALFKTLQKKAQVEEFELLVGSNINQWIEGQVKNFGGEIDFQAVNQLAVFVGGDLWQMSNEIKKLIAYNRKIIIESVNLLVRAKVDDNIFKVMDAISSKNKKMALNLTREQFEEVGNDASYLLNMIVRQFRILIQVKSFSEENSTSTSEMAKMLKLHPFVAQKSLSQASSFSMNQLKDIYNKLMEIEYKTKTGQTPPEVLLELLIAEL